MFVHVFFDPSCLLFCFHLGLLESPCTIACVRMAMAQMQQMPQMPQRLPNGIEIAPYQPTAGPGVWNVGWSVLVRS